MNFHEAQQGGQEERQEYLETLDLSWASKYINKRSYIHKKRDVGDSKRNRTQSQIIVPEGTAFGIKGYQSDLEVFKGPFKGKNATEDDFISLIRDHEGKHAQLSYRFPEIFDVDPVFGFYPLLAKVQRIVEEIICDEFQLLQIEDSGLIVKPKTISGLKKDIKKGNEKLQKVSKRHELDKISLRLINILSGNDTHSDEIRFGT